MEHLHLPETTSTQDVLKEKVRQTGGSYLVSTDFQSGGRGRQGSVWEQFDEAIAFSFNLPPNQTVTLTPLEIGLHLTNYFQKKLKVKWPNDLLNNEKEKVGGILCQLMGDHVLVGIGLNLKGTPSRENFPYPVGSILNESDELSINFKKNLPHEITHYILKNRMSTKSVLDEFPEACIHNDKVVTITNGDEKDVGIFKGIGQNGEAILDVDGQPKKILTGSLRFEL